MKRLLLSLFCISPCFLCLHAQVACGFDELQQKRINADPLYKKSISALETGIQQYIINHKNEDKFKTLSTAAAVFYIPVVVHVIHTGGAVGTIYNPDDAQISGAIDYLNQVYDGTWTGTGGSILGAGDIQIKFVLASKDPAGNPTSGINRLNGSSVANYATNGVNASLTTGASELAVKNLARWDPFKYYNIWVVNKIDGKDGTSGSFIAGYAYFPFGNASAITRNLDGTLMMATQMKAGQKTLPHEIGHAFNLYHVFQGEGSAAGENTCAVDNGDFCADTDPVTDPTDDWEPSPFACRSGTNHCTGLAYNDNTEKNFMNYTNCYRLFTNDQKLRMQATATSTMRASLATSWANGQGMYPVFFSQPVAAGITPVSSLFAGNAAGIMSIELNGRKIYSLNASQENGYQDGSTKWYQLFELEPSNTYTLNIIPLGVNDEQVAVFLDYNGDGNFNNTNEKIAYADQIPAGYGVSFTFTTPAALTGAIVRLRVLEDVSTDYGVPVLTNTTSALSYGQAEDYSVFLKGTVLPVTLRDFSGIATHNDVNLQWQTDNESSMDSYQLERSENGTTFTNIAALPAGNRTGRYQYADAALINGIYFYRLKMMGIDGSFTYSKTIRMQINIISGLEILTNPFSNFIEVKLPAHNGKLVFRLTDINGKILYHSITPGPQTLFRLDIGNRITSPGIYLLETTIDGKRYINKLVKK